MFNTTCNRIFGLICGATYIIYVVRFILNDAFDIGRSMEVRDAFLTIFVLGAWLLCKMDDKK